MATLAMSRWFGQPSRPSSVLLVSRDGVLWNRLVSALCAGRDSGSACEICRPETAAETVLAIDPAVVVVDAERRPARTRDLLADLRRAAPMTPLLLLSDAAAASDATEALKLGAQGQCARRDATVIARAVVAIRNGDAWFPRKVMLHVIRELSRDESRLAPRRPPFATLTSREHDICRMVGEGRCNKEIATALSISDKTVKNHLTAIFRGLGLTSRLELAVFLSRPTARAGRAGGTKVL